MAASDVRREQDQLFNVFCVMVFRRGEAAGMPVIGSIVLYRRQEHARERQRGARPGRREGVQ